ncbi:MAG: hypothetical protein BMS9Abin36_0526 [Gammaproteobacteria bacterium]|nr:MAG: hypothetical protein BMS9Abin36_0526 [Gammaproteobacteria bacterium]
MAISSPGLGSGLDVNSLVTQLVGATALPVTQRIDRQEINLQAKLTAFGTLKGSLSTFQDSLNSLGNLATYQGRSVTVGDSDVLTAIATKDASEASYNVTVSQLATAQTLASNSFTNTSDVVGEGTLTLSFGDYDGAAFSLNADRGTFTITIDSTNNTLAGIRDAINAADAGVSASIINDGSGNRLVLGSKFTGAENSLKITVSDTTDASDLDNSGLSQLAYDPEATVGNGKNLEQKQTAQDAAVVIDGISVSSASNTLSETIEGVTLTLKSVSTSAVSLNISNDDNSIKSAIKSFVDEYNVLAETIQGLTNYNKETKESGILLSDSIVRGLNNQLRKFIGGIAPGLTGSYTSLSSIGISSDKEGKLSLDNSKLDNVLALDRDAVSRLFAATGLPTDSDIEFVTSSDATQSGNYSINISTLATQGLLAGSGITTPTVGSPVSIIAGSNTLSLLIDGIASNTITLTAGSYTSGTALATELQSRINGDSSLAAAGVSATVRYVADTGTAGHLEIESSRYGSSSTVEITANTTTVIGLSIATGTVGVDVAGSLGTQAGEGNGRILKGVGNSSGLEIDVAGTTTGDRGTIRFTNGLVSQLGVFMDSYLSSDGTLDSRTSSLSNQIDGLSDERESLGRRLQALEARYRAQFTALDIMVSQLRSTSDFLTQQLANLPGAWQKK